MFNNICSGALIKLRKLLLAEPYSLVLQLYIKFQGTVVILIDKYFTGRVFFCHVNLSPILIIKIFARPKLFHVDTVSEVATFTPILFSKALYCSSSFRFIQSRIF